MGIITTSGFKEMQAKLKKAGQKATNVYMKTALKESGAPIVQAGILGFVPRKSGRLAKAVKIRAGSNKKEEVSVKVGFSRANFGQKTFYAPYVDAGHFEGRRLSRELTKGPGAKEAYRRRSLAAGRLFVPGVNFMHNGFASSKDRAETAIMAKLKELVFGELQ